MPLPSAWLAALTDRWRSIFRPDKLSASAVPTDPLDFVPGTQADAAFCQPGVGRDFIRWVYPGRCPDCGAAALRSGPRGGAAVNCRCANCGQWWNTLWPQPRRNKLALIERIDK